MRGLEQKEGGFLDDKVAFTKYSIDNDPMDIRHFEELKTHSKELLKSEEAGSKEYPQFPEAQQDMYDALYKNNPDINEEWMMKREFLLNRKIIEKLTDSPRYKELRVMTTLDVVNSTVGTQLMSEEMIKLIKELQKEREALQGVVDAAGAMAQAQANAQGKGQPGGKNGPGKGKKTEELTLEQAKEKYDQAMEKFQELTNRPEFKQSIDKITARVQDQVRETSDLISNWGLESSGSFQRKSAQQKMELLNRLRNSSKLRKIAQLAGRFRRLAQLHKRERIKTGQDEMYTINQGNNIARLIPSEMLRLLHPSTRMPFLLDLLEGKTLEYKIQGKQKKGKGPVIIALDSSGSMDGVPEINFCFLDKL